MKSFGTYALLCIGLLAVGVGLWKAREERFVPLEYLPTTDATLVNVDFHALRQAGILSMLAGKPGIEEPEYREFIRATGFDYRKDLESATVAFGPDATYFVVRGRFNWDKLESYAKANGGSCYDRLCHLPGSRPERRISFVPLRNNVMALAVSPDDLAAARLTHPDSGTKIDAPKDPVWVSIPASALKRTASMSAGARLFAAAVSGADRVTLTLSPKNGGDYSARLEAVCASTKDAQAITAQLSKVTSTLKEAAANSKASGDLAGLLVAGTFQQSDKKVFGYWPIRKGLLENLAGGI